MKKENPKISAALRTITGRKVKHLRSSGQIPATIYGHKFEPISIQFSALELNKIFEQVGESSLVEIIVGENNYPIIFKNPQFHPISSDLIHIDCYKVNLKEKITTTVPVELIGESLAVKNGNTLMQILSEIEIEALPADLPDKIEVKNDSEQAVVIIEAPRVEEEPVVEAEAELTPEDVPATAQKTEEEKAAKAAQEASEKDEK